MTKEELSNYCALSLKRLDVLYENIREVCPRGKDSFTTVELAAASAFFHYFYTHVEEVLRQIVLFDGITEHTQDPGGSQRLLKTAGELGIIPPDLFKPLSELHSFRSAFLLGQTESMNGSAVAPLVDLLPGFRDSFRREVSEYLTVVDSD